MCQLTFKHHPVAPLTLGHEDSVSAMKIHIYTDIANLFGQACRVWMDVLVEAGHEVELVDIGTGNEKPLPDVGRSDVNLLVTGLYAMARFKTWGMPRHGKNILWMFDPLTRQEEAVMHGYKATAFDAIAGALDAVVAMDISIQQYVQRHHPRLPTLQIPYLIASRNIHTPMEESGRTGQLIFMGGKTTRREAAETCFQARGTPAEFVWTGLWGAAREEKRRRSRISLNIHADPAHTYFDQFRTLEAWAAGTVVATETTDGLAHWGIEPGRHLAMADLDALPEACAALLADAAQRTRMTEAAQALLRLQFSPERWRREMLSAITQLP
jgi:hypothetical protein